MLAMSRWLYLGLAQVLLASALPHRGVDAGIDAKLVFELPKMGFSDVVHSISSSIDSTALTSTTFVTPRPLELRAAVALSSTTLSAVPSSSFTSSSPQDATVTSYISLISTTTTTTTDFVSIYIYEFSSSTPVPTTSTAARSSATSSISSSTSSSKASSSSTKASSSSTPKKSTASTTKKSTSSTLKKSTTSTSKKTTSSTTKASTISTSEFTTALIGSSSSSKPSSSSQHSTASLANLVSVAASSSASAAAGTSSVSTSLTASQVSKFSSSSSTSSSSEARSSSSLPSTSSDSTLKATSTTSFLKSSSMTSTTSVSSKSTTTSTTKATSSSTTTISSAKSSTVTSALVTSSTPVVSISTTTTTLIEAGVTTTTTTTAPVTTSSISLSTTTLTTPTATTTSSSELSTKVSSGSSSKSASKSSTSTSKKSSTVSTKSSSKSSITSSKKSSTTTATLATTLTTSQVQAAPVTSSANQTGTVISSLQTSGHATAQPFNTTVIPTPSTTISKITTGSEVITSTTSVGPSTMPTGNIFVAISTGAPPAQIPARSDHPVSPSTIVNSTGPYETNKFYGNFIVGDGYNAAWTHPWSVYWAQGGGSSGSWGLSISQIDRTQVTFGPGDPAAYFINPLQIQYMVMSAVGLGENAVLTVDTPLPFSANINLAQSNTSSPAITFPLVQGMGFVTGVYENSIPLIQSGVFFKTLTYGGLINSNVTAKYEVILNDNSQWLIYLTPFSGQTMPVMTLANQSDIISDRLFSGSCQIVKNPNGAVTMPIYDESAGVYPLRGSVSATVSGSVGSYTLSWTKGGMLNQTLLMFALPHHIQILQDSQIGDINTSLQLETTTKGLATAVTADSWTLIEPDMPIDVGFAPWSASTGSVTTLPASAIALINNISASELAQDFAAQTDLNSMYYSGKALAKFASMIYAVNDLANNTGAASAGISKLKDCFNTFVNNTQIIPLAYDSVWGGAVSTASYNGGPSGADFGNTYYNDHHFHYGYFVYAAAVIGYLDPTWVTEGTNKAWVNMLVRDYANPSTTDPYFPFSRMFDWFHGHSWAGGLFSVGDGKDEESTSEDVFASYGMKLWGHVLGDANMEARGNLMLAMQARSLHNYFLMESDNTIQPAEFINNRADGIMFENKVDHTTYFGTNIEYIEGIHMLPLAPISHYTRTQNFVTEEWDDYFVDYAANVTGGWRGILYANLAIINATASYQFFAQEGFSNEWLDGGASRTWYLAQAAALGGAE